MCEFVGPPCGHHGALSFYRACSFFAANNKKVILSLGEFFFVRISDREVCIGELQLLWLDRNRNESLSSSRFYFLPNNNVNNNNNNNHHHNDNNRNNDREGGDDDQQQQQQLGQDEVLAMSEKVVLRLSDLVTWVTSRVRWDRHQKELVPSSTTKTTRTRTATTTGSATTRQQQQHNNIINNNNEEKRGDVIATTTRDAAHDENDDDVNGEKDEDGEDEEDDDAACPPTVTVLSYPRYCRYRAIAKRLESVVGDSWLKNSIVRLLGGGVAALPASSSSSSSLQSRRHRVLFCRDTVDRQDIEANQQLCNNLAPNLKGRPRKKKRLKNSRGHSPSSESSAEEAAWTMKETRLNNHNNNNSTRRLNKLKVQSLRNGLRRTPEESRKEEEFLDKLFRFMRERNSPIERVPHLGFKQINLYLFYTYAQNLGGYEKVTLKRLWKQIYDVLGGSPGSTSAATCTRRHYERLLLPYERYAKGEEDRPLPPPVKHRRANTLLKQLSMKMTSDKPKAVDAIVPPPPSNAAELVPCSLAVCSSPTDATAATRLSPPLLLQQQNGGVVSPTNEGPEPLEAKVCPDLPLSSSPTGTPAPLPAAVDPIILPTLPAEAPAPLSAGSMVEGSATDMQRDAELPVGTADQDSEQKRQMHLARKKLKEERISEKERKWDEIRRQNALERDRVRQMSFSIRSTNTVRPNSKPQHDGLPLLSPITPPEILPLDSSSQPTLEAMHQRQTNSVDLSPPPHLEPQLPPLLPSPDPLSVASNENSSSTRAQSPAMEQLPPPPPLVDLTRVVNALPSTKVDTKPVATKLVDNDIPAASIKGFCTDNVENVRPDQHHPADSYSQMLMGGGYGREVAMYRSALPPSSRGYEKLEYRQPPMSVTPKVESSWTSCSNAFSQWTQHLSDLKPKVEMSSRKSSCYGPPPPPVSSNSSSPTPSVLARPSVIQHTPKAVKSLTPSPSLSQHSSPSPGARPSPALSCTFPNYRCSKVPPDTCRSASASCFGPSTAATTSAIGLQYYQYYNSSSQPPPSSVSAMQESSRDSAKKPRLESPLFPAPQYYPSPKVFVQPQSYRGSPYVSQYYVPYSSSSGASSSSCDDEVLDLSMKKAKVEKAPTPEAEKFPKQPVQLVNPLPEYERITPPEKELDLSVKSRSHYAPLPTLESSRAAQSSSCSNPTLLHSRASMMEMRKEVTPRTASVVPMVHVDVRAKTAATERNPRTPPEMSKAPVEPPKRENDATRMTATTTCLPLVGKQSYYSLHSHPSQFYAASSVYSLSPQQFLSSAAAARPFVPSEHLQASITAYKDVYPHLHSMFSSGQYPYSLPPQLYPHLYKEGQQPSSYLYPPK